VSNRITDPVISQPVIPDRAAEQGKLADSLAQLVRDDPTLRFRTDPDTGQLILSGRSEPHLEEAVAKLVGMSGVKVTAGKPVPVYRQTISTSVEVETRHQADGGRGMFAIVSMRFEPLTREQCAGWAERCQAQGEEPDPNNLYFSDNSGGAVPPECALYAEKGFREAAGRGFRYGLQCVDMQVTLLGGKFHEVGGYYLGFKPAAVEYPRRSGPWAHLLEPVMSVVVNAPGSHLDAVADDIERRRGAVLDFSSGEGLCSVHAHVPLATLLGYAGDLRDAVGGTASFRSEPSHYARVPEEFAVARFR
jgi:elongation factor G